MEENVGSNANGGWSTREVLIRVDAKVDSLTQSVAAKHAHYDVEIALLKARSEELERQRDEAERDRQVAESQTKAKMEANEAKVSALATRQNIAAGAIALIVAVSPLMWILVNKLVN